jgi:penicillin-binding protein 1A
MAAIRKTKTRLEAGFVALDPINGYVRAWVGSRDYVTAPYDHVASSRRQPGSTFKPVVYAAALEAGFTPDMMVRNQAVEIQTSGADVWRLASASNAAEFVSLREGLAKSHNNVAAQLMQSVGARKTAAMAERLGVRQSRLDEVPSLALGTSPVSLLEMASVYATIAAEGIYNEPALITRIADATGDVKYEHSSHPQRAMSQESALYLTDMLRDVVDYGTGQRIRYQFGVQGDVGGKTGTTQNNMDGWFMSVHPQLTTGAWIGFDDPRITFRSDFWGEGAHNALFIVGDVLRQAVASGVVNTRVRFSNPPQPVVRDRFADRASTWVGRQFGRLAESMRGAGDQRSRPQIRPDWIAEQPERRGRASEASRRSRRSPDRRISELSYRLQEYEQLKQRIAEGLQTTLDDGRLDDRLLEAYRRERESNPDLQQLERELDGRIRRWIDEAERRISESDGR